MNFRSTNNNWRDLLFGLFFSFSFLYIFCDFPGVTFVHFSFEAQASSNLKFTHMSTNQIRVVKEDFLVNKSVLGRNFSDFTLAQFRLVVIFQMRNFFIFISFRNLHHLKMAEVFLGFHALNSSNVLSQKFQGSWIVNNIEIHDIANFQFSKDVSDHLTSVKEKSFTLKIQKSAVLFLNKKFDLSVLGFFQNFHFWNLGFSAVHLGFFCGWGRVDVSRKGSGASFVEEYFTHG